MRRYVAFVFPPDRRDASWGVAFPDFPGCVATEDDFDAAVSAGAQALRLHVEGLLEDRVAIPEPRPLEAIRVDPEFVDDIAEAMIALVPLLPPRSAAERVTISLDRNLLRAIDHAAAARGLTRSRFLAEGAQAMLEAAPGEGAASASVAVKLGRPRRAAPRPKAERARRSRA